MADFAVSPDDPDVVLATTERELASSGDDGLTFPPRTGATSAASDLAAGGAIVGVDPDGQVHVSTDAAESW